MKTAFLLFSAWLLALSSFAQGGGIVQDGAESSERYKIAIKVRPLSFLIAPMTSGNLASYNGRVDVAFNRLTALGIEGNYFSISENSIFSNGGDAKAFSLRLDLMRFSLDEQNDKRYAEGLHYGPYVKLRHEALTNNFGVGVQSTENVESFILGGLIGLQSVSNHFVVNQNFGLGIGLAASSFGVTRINLDIRLGLSFGFAL